MPITDTSIIAVDSSVESGYWPAWHAGGNHRPSWLWEWRNARCARVCCTVIRSSTRHTHSPAHLLPSQSVVVGLTSWRAPAFVLWSIRRHDSVVSTTGQYDQWLTDRGHCPLEGPTARQLVSRSNQCWWLHGVARFVIVWRQRFCRRGRFYSWTRRDKKQLLHLI